MAVSRQKFVLRVGDLRSGTAAYVQRELDIAKDIGADLYVMRTYPVIEITLGLGNDCTSGGGHDPQISNRVLLWPRIMAEAQYIARVTCRQVELVLIEVETRDRAGRRVMLIGKLPFYH